MTSYQIMRRQMIR